MKKAALRKIFLERRKLLSPADSASYNRRMYDLFFASTDLAFVRVLHLFLPIEKRNEPDTWLFVDRFRREFPHIQLSVPRISAASPDLENINFEGLHQIVENRWGIPEPRQGVPTPSAKIDMVLVPLLAFDTHGNRVGYGKGFYDRFLRTCRSDCKKIGLCFFEPVDSIDDTDVFDVRLDSVVTPDNIFQW